MQNTVLKEDRQPFALMNSPPIFARHETFHPRFGWLKKGFDCAVKDPSLFLRDDSPVILGVGKNMVKSIKYWCYAFKILSEQKSKGQIGNFTYPTDLGSNLLVDRGWDPYLEDPASLWLLHWNLMKMPCKATSWYFVFNEFHKYEFTAGNLLKSLDEFTRLNFPRNRVVESSLKKDINCILRMYSEILLSKGFDEDSIDSPFCELGLIKHSTDSRHFYFVTGPKNGLSPEIVVSACLEYIAFTHVRTRTIAISTLLFEEGSPGMIFKLSEDSLCEAIDRIALRFDSIRLGDTAGVIQFSFMGDPCVLAIKLLKKYYQIGNR